MFIAVDQLRLSPTTRQEFYDNTLANILENENHIKMTKFLAFDKSTNDFNLLADELNTIRDVNRFDFGFYLSGEMAKSAPSTHSADDDDVSY